MHKTITTFVMVAATLLLHKITFAQVGINTTTPQEQLHVAGTTSTIRVDGLNSANNADNDGVSPANVSVDADGNLVIHNSLILIQDMNSAAFLNPTVKVLTTDGTFVRQQIYTTTFNLDKPAIVEFNILVSAGVSDATGVTPITDGVNRKYGIELLIDGTDIGRAANSFSNGEGTATTDWLGNPNTITYNSGYFTLNLNIKKQLAAGNHTLVLNGQVVGAEETTTAGMEVEFGDTLNYSYLQILKYN
jgi:hypothetical protein